VGVIDNDGERLPERDRLEAPRHRDIPFQTRLSLDDLKRIVTVKCSFVEGIAVGI
jgi:hypothetical protein